MNRQQRRGIMKELRTFMESVSGRKFKTLMESFRAGMTAILEAEDGESGVTAQDVNGGSKKFLANGQVLYTHVFHGLTSTAKSIKDKIHALIKLEKNLRKIHFGESSKEAKKKEENFNEIFDAIEYIKAVQNLVGDMDPNENVEDSTKSEIISKIDGINKIAFDNLIDIHRMPDISGVDTFGKLKSVLPDIKSVFSSVLDRLRKEENKEGLDKFVSIPSTYKIDKNGDGKIDTKRLLDMIPEIPDIKEKLKELRPDDSGNLKMDPDTANIVADKLDRMSKSLYTGSRIKDDDFAAAVLLFYSIAAKKSDFQIVSGQMELKERNDISGPGTPRENMILALYVLLGKTALSMRRWIVGSAPGIDWETFETNFKFRLIGRAMSDTGSQNMNVYDLEDTLPTHSLFIKAVDDGQWVPGQKIDEKLEEQEEEEQEEEEQEEEGEQTNGSESESDSKNEKDSKKNDKKQKFLKNHPNKKDFYTKSEEELTKIYGGWIEKNGEYYVPRDTKSYDGRGNLVGMEPFAAYDEKGNPVDLDTQFDECGYLSVVGQEELGKGSGTLDVCYSSSDFVKPEYINAASKIYDASVELAKIFLKYDKPNKNEISTEDVIEDNKSTALCIFYSYIVNTTILDPFKVTLYDSAAKTIYNIVHNMKAEARKDAPPALGDVNVSFSDLGGGSSNRKSDYNGSDSEKDVSDIVTERMSRSIGVGTTGVDAFETPGNEIPITIKSNGIVKLPEKYKNLLHDIYNYSEENPDVKYPVKEYFEDIIHNTNDRKKKIQMYMDILKTAGLPSIMSDVAGDYVYNSRKEDLDKAFSIFTRTVLLSEEEIAAVTGFVDGKIVPGQDQYEDEKVELAIKKINSVLALGDREVDSYTKLMNSIADEEYEKLFPGEKREQVFDLRDIVDKYNERKEETHSDMTVNGVGIGKDWNKDYIVHEIESVASKDVSGILKPLMQKFNSIENGVPIPINPPKNAFGIGTKGFSKTFESNGNKITVSDVIVFGKANKKKLGEIGINTAHTGIATRDGRAEFDGNTSDIDAFPPIQNYRDTYSDAIKNAKTYASIVGQIYSILSYLSQQQYTEFRNDKVVKILSNEPSDEIQAYITERVCEYLKPTDKQNSITDISGDIADESSAMRKFLDNVIGNVPAADAPSGMDDICDAYNKLIMMLSTDPKEMNWKAHGDLEKFAVRHGEKDSPSELEFKRHLEDISSRTIQLSDMVPELANVIKSRKPEDISYGDLIYLMLVGGLGLHKSKAGVRTKGSYYDAFLNLVENYNDLKTVSDNISMEVCGENNERVSNMAAAILLLILSTANDLSLKYYDTIKDYSSKMNKIDAEKRKIEKKMDKSSNGSGEAESTKDEESSMEKLMERYHELTMASSAERRKIVHKLKTTVIGLAEKVIESDFNSVINGLIKNVSFENNKLDIGSTGEIGRILLNTIGNPRQAYNDLEKKMGSFKYFNANKYIKSLNSRSDIDKTIADIISNDVVFNSDNELSKYSEEFALAIKRAERVGEKQPINNTDIIDELSVITNDQIIDALAGKGGLFTDEYVGGARANPLDRVELVCKAIMCHLVDKTKVFGENAYANGVSSTDFYKMTRDILNDDTKKIKLVEELDKIYNSDIVGSIKAFVKAITTLFGTGMRHGPATDVLVSLVSDVKVSDFDDQKSDELPEEIAQTTLFKIINISGRLAVQQGAENMDYYYARKFLERHKREIIAAVKDIRIDSDNDIVDDIITIAEDFIPAVGEKNPLRRELYSICEKVLTILMNKVIDYELNDVEENVLASIRNVYGENLEDENILETSGILTDSGDIRQEAIVKMANYIVDNTEDVESIVEEINRVVYHGGLRYKITEKTTDLGEIVETWNELVYAAKQFI